jgi:hypothetical protein
VNETVNQGLLNTPVHGVCFGNLETNPMQYPLEAERVVRVVGAS